MHTTEDIAIAMLIRLCQCNAINTIDVIEYKERINYKDAKNLRNELLKTRTIFHVKKLFDERCGDVALSPILKEMENDRKCAS